MVDNTDSDSGGSSFVWSTSPSPSAATEETNHEGALLQATQEYKQPGVHFSAQEQSHSVQKVWHTMVNVGQQATVPIIKQPRMRPTILHDIALRHVFEAVFPPSGFLNPALSLGPDSPWSRALRSRKALTLVCRQWRDVALPLLYKDVVLRRASQISALQRTVSSNPELFGPMIRSITALCYVPRTLRTAAMTRLKMIIDRTTYLRSVSWGPLFISTVDFLPASSVDLLYTALFTKTDTLTRFEYNQSLRREVAFPRQLLLDLHNLTHITIFMPKTDPPYPARPFRHESLKVLRFVYMNGDLADADMTAFCAWSLPALEQVQFRPFIDFAGPPRSYCEFLRAHKRIDTLDLGCCPVINLGLDETVTTELYTQTQRVLESFVAFRHLIIPARIGGTHILDTTLATSVLPHVDLWTHVGDERLTAALTPEDRWEYDPAGDEPLEDFKKHWRSVRMIDNGLSTVLDLPRLLSPNDRPPPGVTEVHDIFGMGIHETHAYIVRHDRAWSGVSYNAPDAVANIYAYVSEDEYPDTSSSEDSDGDVAMAGANHDTQDSDMYVPPEDDVLSDCSEWTDDAISEGELNDMRNAWFEDYGALPEQVGLEELDDAFDTSDDSDYVDEGYSGEDEDDEETDVTDDLEDDELEGLREDDELEGLRED